MTPDLSSSNTAVPSASSPHQIQLPPVPDFLIKYSYQQRQLAPRPPLPTCFAAAHMAGGHLAVSSALCRSSSRGPVPGPRGTRASSIPSSIPSTTGAGQGRPLQLGRTVSVALVHPVPLQAPPPPPPQPGHVRRVQLRFVHHVILQIPTRADGACPATCALGAVRVRSSKKLVGGWRH